MTSAYFPDGHHDEFEAHGTTSCTLVGYNLEGPPPWPRGNCFSVHEAQPSRRPDWRIVNFSYENLQALLKIAGPVRWPIRCAVIHAERRVAVIHDPRISAPWYQERWCESCCPAHLLPLPQRLLGKLREDSGREVNSGVICSRRMGAFDFDARLEAGTLFFPRLADLVSPTRLAEEELYRNLPRDGSPLPVDADAATAMEEAITRVYDTYVTECGEGRRAQRELDGATKARMWVGRICGNRGYRIHDDWADRIKRACCAGTCP